MIERKDDYTGRIHIGDGMEEVARQNIALHAENDMLKIQLELSQACAKDLQGQLDGARAYIGKLEHAIARD